LIFVLFIVTIINRRAKKRIAEAEAQSAAMIEDMQKTMEEDKLRKSIEEAAKEHNESINATANEVKEFAKKNPEIAAALIRSMMKE
jgi:flagellar biosynthesis/type III secretory pathway M-ring protein FliF/YscJ